MSFIYNNNTFIINKINHTINIKVINIDNKIYEVNITQTDLSNNFNIDNFYIFIIKCLNKNKYYHIKLININTQLIIRLSLKLNDFSIGQNITLDFKLNSTNIEIIHLQNQIKELQIEYNKIKIASKELNIINLLKNKQSNKQKKEINKKFFDKIEKIIFIKNK